MISIQKMMLVNNEHLYGPGKRLLIYLKGCSIHCEGCINPHLWAFEGGTLLSSKEVIKIIADNYLENVRQVNGVRNMLGYTGFYKGKKVTVMGSGMGMPSIGIYSYELFKEYDAVLSPVSTGPAKPIDYKFGKELINIINTPSVQQAFLDAGYQMYIDAREKAYGRPISLADINVTPYLAQIESQIGYDFSDYTGGVGSTNKGDYPAKHLLRYVFYKYYYTLG